jgi:hypothetical protein
MRLSPHHRHIALAGLIGLLVGGGLIYGLFHHLMSEGMSISARYKLVLSTQSVQLLKNNEYPQVLAIQERALVNAVQAARIALSSHDSASLRALLDEGERYLKQNPSANTADWEAKPKAAP